MDPLSICLPHMGECFLRVRGCLSHHFLRVPHLGSSSFLGRAFGVVLLDRTGITHGIHHHLGVPHRGWTKSASHRLVVYLKKNWVHASLAVATQNISPFPKKSRKSPGPPCFILGVPQEHKDAPKSTWNPKRGPWTMDFHFAATEASDPETAEETALRLRRLRKAQRRGFGIAPRLASPPRLASLPVALGWRRGGGHQSWVGKAPKTRNGGSRPEVRCGLDTLWA